MDTAFLFSWYDVPEDGRADYLDWLHRRYMPMVAARDGVLWGAHYKSSPKPPPAEPGRIKETTDPAVPRGTGYILIFGATAAKVFLTPTVEEFHDTLKDADRAMLALRQGARSSVLVEDDRVDGAESANYPDPAPSIQVGSFDAAPDIEDDAAAWFARQRLPSMQGRPGAVRMRSMVAVSGWARHACFYEFTSVAERERYMSDNQGQPWSDRVARRLLHMPGSPAVAQRIWPLEQRASSAVIAN